MSKVRREKHKYLVTYQKVTKKMKTIWPSGLPRWRQSLNARYKNLIKEYKK